MSKVLKIRDLTLRDGQQSSFATRMTQEQIDRCLPYYKDAGFFAMEVWGGAVPDSVMRYLGENPWTRLEKIHESVGDVSKLTALSRGRNLFGYAPYTDEIIEGFCRNSIESGLGIMRIFDCLNDVDNVGRTGRHMTCFTMGTHTVINREDDFIYWEDETIRLCHEFFKSIGINTEEIRFIKSWWSGGDIKSLVVISI